MLYKKCIDDFMQSKEPLKHTICQNQIALNITWVLPEKLMRPDGAEIFVTLYGVSAQTQKYFKHEAICASKSS